MSTLMLVARFTRPQTDRVDSKKRDMPFTVEFADDIGLEVGKLARKREETLSYVWHFESKMIIWNPTEGLVSEARNFSWLPRRSTPPQKQLELQLEIA